MENKIIQAKCRNLLKEYEDILKYIVEEEESKLLRDNTLGNSEFEIVKNAIFNSGVREGMRKIVSRINENAKEKMDT